MTQEEARFNLLKLADTIETDDSYPWGISDRRTCFFGWADRLFGEGHVEPGDGMELFKLRRDADLASSNYAHLTMPNGWQDGAEPTRKQAAEALRAFAAGGSISSDWAGGA